MKKLLSFNTQSTFITLRLSLGFIFLWAFFDKLFGLGYATTSAKSWLNGSSPTYGFLKFGTDGPFSNIFQSLAGNPIVDCLFMLGLLCIGFSLISGVAFRFACYCGILFMSLLWLASFPSENNPLIDEHIIYALVLYIMSSSKLSSFISKFSLYNWWKNTYVARKLRFLA